jgi:hypothetical protein
MRCGKSGEDPLGRVAQQDVSTATFVQMNYATPQNPVATVQVPFTAAQAGGDLNVVAVGWNDTTAQVISVTDSIGNSYLRAVGPTQFPNQLTQSIYYARNIAPAAAGANTVTVSFNVLAIWADVRILEYSGLDPVNPIDVTAAGTGTSSTSSTPAVITTSAPDLLFAANMVVSFTAGPGAGWTNEVITQPNGDIAEDTNVTTVGSYTSTASVPGGGAWVQQMVAFRVAGAVQQPPGPPTNLTAVAASSSRINLSWRASTGSVTAYLIERCSGAGCANFSQIDTTTGTTYSNTGLSAVTGYTYRVRATDGVGDLSGYSNSASATTGSPPSNPTNLTATPVSSSQIYLSWTASTGNVSSYLIESCSGVTCNFSQIATTAGSTTYYNHTGLTPATTYSYRVRASDGNLSGYSNTASARTPAQGIGPIASSNFVGSEDPLYENGLWAPLTSLSPNGVRLMKNNGAFPDQFVSQNHGGARTTAAIPIDHYSEIVVGHLGDNTNNVGPIVRVQTSGPSIDSHYLWWASRANGHNYLYRIDANGTSYGPSPIIPTSPVVDGDTLRLIARGPVIYGIKNGVRDFIYNTGADAPNYLTGTTGILAFVSSPTVTDATIASWNSGAAPASSGTWTSSTFTGAEDPLNEGDRWYPLPTYAGFRKANGSVIGKVDGDHNASGVWSIAPPARQYSQVTLGTVTTGGGGPIVRIDRSNAAQTGWLLFLWADNPSGSGIYKMVSGNFIAVQYFTPTIVSGDRWRLTADGNTLQVFQNGLLQFSYTTDGSYAAGDVGIEAFTTAFTFTAWEGGDLAGH